MGNKRSLVLILSGFSIVLITLFFSLPVFIESLTTDRLSRLGFTNVDLEIDDIGLSTTQVRLNNLTYISHGRLYRLQDSNIQLEYSLNRLLSGRIDHVHIVTTKLIIENQVNSRIYDAADSVTFPQPGYELPFQRLSLDLMRIEYASSDGRVSLIDLQGKLYTDSNGVHGMLKVSSSQSAPVLLNIELAKSQNLILITDENNKSPIASLKIAPVTEKDDQQQVNFTLQADLKAMQGLLASWDILPLTEDTSGSLMADGQLSWPGEKSLTGEITLADFHMGLTAKLNMNIASGFVYAEDINLSLPLTIKIQNRVLQWHLGKTSRVSFYPGKGDIRIQKILAAQGRQAIIIRTPQGLTGQIQLDADIINWSDIRFDDALHITYGNEKTLLALQLALTGTTINLHTPIKIKSDITYTAIARQASWMYAKSGQLTGAAQFELTENDLDFVILPDNHIAIRELAYAAITTPGIDGKLTTKVKCNVKLDDTSWECADINLKLKISETSFNNNRIQAGSSNIQVKELAKSSDGWLLTAQADMTAITIMAYEHSVKLDTVQAVIQGNHKQVSLDLGLSAVDSLVTARLKAVHSLDSGTGRADFQLKPITYTVNNRILNRLFDREYLPLKIDSGQLTANTNLSWQLHPAHKDSLQLKQMTRMKLQDIGGSYLDTDFTGLNTALVLRGIESIHTEKPAHIQLAKLDPGLAISDVSFDMEISKGTAGLPVISATHFTANLLGGQISSDHINYDLSRDENDFTVQVEQMDIEELLKLYQNKSVYGTGIIDGVLPFVISADGLKMTKGRLTARTPGGVLRYIANETVKSMAESNKNMSILVDALKDFHYSVLNTDLQYSPDGLLKMYLQIEGHNPNLDGGRPIHLNINVEENILALMRSLTLADDIGKEIGEQLQKP